MALNPFRLKKFLDMNGEKEEVFTDYTQSLNIIREEYIYSGSNEHEFKTKYFESLKSLQEENKLVVKKRKSNKLTILLCLIISCSAFYFVIMNFRLFHNNLQEYIHPFLHVLRKLSIPFISLFPSLTEYYHETCLLQNPFFSIVDMDCWPCSSVNNVREIMYSDNSQLENKAPFVYETQQQQIKLYHIRNLYERHKQIFDKESPNVIINNKRETNIEEMFSMMQEYHKNNFVWKFNTMNTARILRQMIPRPKAVPKFGQSTERFLVINTDQKYFRLPDTECGYSFILALSGTRFIELIPAEECKQHCKSLEVELKESYLLFPGGIARTLSGEPAWLVI